MTTTPDDQPTTAAAGTAAGTPDVVSQYIEKARSFAKAKPAATAALAGVLGIAILNTLRGKK